MVALRSGIVTRVLLLLLAITFSLLVAVVAGVLSWAADGSVPRAVLYAGGAFVVWMTLCISLCSAFGLLDNPVRRSEGVAAPLGERTSARGRRVR